MQIYNSLTRQKEEFKSIVPNKVGIYVCGPTVYGMPHLGHAKSYVFFDVLIRYFKHLGYDVKYVQNITDVGHLVGDGDFGEDKIQKKAKLEKIDPMQIAYMYENIYFKYMEKLNVLKPSISCRATGHISDMIDMIKILVDKGYAYVTEKGNVYFEVSKYDEYAKLSLRDIEKNETGTRVEEKQDKRNANDFALWKRNIDNHLMEWDSPWGKGYPGWHIECSAMSKKYLGDNFDIHGGGLDNMFPHHDCEIAQSECANGTKFANYFMHNNLVTVDGRKMGKSLGNYISLDELLDKYEPDFIRFYLLLVHYRKPTNFSSEKMKEAHTWYDKLREMFIDVLNTNLDNVEPKAKDTLEKDYIAEMEAALADDIDTYGVIVMLYELYNLYKKDKENTKLISELQKIYNTIITEVLGVTFNVDTKNSEKEESKEQELIRIISEVREELRKEKKYDLSDKIREELQNLDINISDK